jgi:hypothetical protein
MRLPRDELPVSSACCFEIAIAYCAGFVRYRTKSGATLSRRGTFLGAQ